MTQDTRKDRRVKIVSLNVRYKSATVDEFIENHAHDVSRGGIYIKTGNPFPPGTLLKFEIRLASDQAVIAGVGRIVWKRDVGGSTGERPAGMGVKFIKIDEPSKAVIDRLVNSRSDAGKSFETSDDAVVAPDRTKTSPPGRPSAPGSPSPSSASLARAAMTRSMTPAAGTPAAAKSEGPPATSVPAGAPFARKATMVGLGTMSSAPPAASSPPGAPAAAGRAPFSAAPTVPPRPGTGHSSMFPKSDADRPPVPQEEQTVMRQAAELLEDALREAGGSMSEIGTNPLFSESAASASIAKRKSVSPLTPASEWTTADTPQALAATIAAMRAEEAAKEASGQRQSAAPESTRDAPKSVRPAVAVTASRDSDTAPRRSGQKKKSSSATTIVVVVASMIVVAGVMFRDKIFGEGPPPEPVAVPTAPAAPPPTTTASVAATIVPPAMSAAPAPTPSAEPSASAATQPSASAAPTRSYLEASAGAASATPSALAVPPRPPRPPASARPPVNPPPAIDTPAAPPIAATSTEGATAAPPPAKAPPAPPKVKAAKPPDDNPY